MMPMVEVMFNGKWVSIEELTTEQQAKVSSGITQVLQDLRDRTVQKLTGQEVNTSGKDRY